MVDFIFKCKKKIVSNKICFIFYKLYFVTKLENLETNLIELNKHKQNQIKFIRTQTKSNSGQTKLDTNQTNEFQLTSIKVLLT